MTTNAGSVQVNDAGGMPSQPRPLRVGERLVMGRGSEADLDLGEDPWLPRRLGELEVGPDSVRVRNISRRHTLHVQSGDEAIALPAGMSGGYVLPAGASLLGTAAMLADDRPVRVELAQAWGPPVPPAPDPRLRTQQISTQPRLRLSRETKEFMVALLLCRPWLNDPTRLAPLPTAPEIAEEALRITSAARELDVFASDPKARARIQEQVHTPLRGLREKLTAHRLVDGRTRLGQENLAAALLYYDVITRNDLRLLTDTEWLNAQENKWWGSI
ncbi:hypothetical protein SMC26_10085 [Actinomadura fulvescens]|uniref:FHA domain-containing protein n=1 Tax=Actinomadura fulvescens TaxID=46160 RepID=A0ABN3Q2P3_9ACTN